MADKIYEETFNINIETSISGAVHGFEDGVFGLKAPNDIMWPGTGAADADLKNNVVRNPLVELVANDADDVVTISFTDAFEDVAAFTATFYSPDEIDGNGGIVLAMTSLDDTTFTATSAPVTALMTGGDLDSITVYIRVADTEEIWVPPHGVDALPQPVRVGTPVATHITIPRYGVGLVEGPDYPSGSEQADMYPTPGTTNEIGGGER